MSEGFYSSRLQSRYGVRRKLQNKPRDLKTFIFASQEYEDYGRIFPHAYRRDVMHFYWNNKSLLVPGNFMHAEISSGLANLSSSVWNLITHPPILGSHTFHLIPLRPIHRLAISKH